MSDSERRATDQPLKPLFWGRTLRVAAGAILLYFAIRLWGATWASEIGSFLLGLLGVSFLIGGAVANPGCETTALPNLFLSQEKRVYHY